MVCGDGAKMILIIRGLIMVKTMFSWIGAGLCAVVYGVSFGVGFVVSLIALGFQVGYGYVIEKIAKS